MGNGLENVRREVLNTIEKWVFGTRFVLIPFYICLLMALFAYSVAIFKETYHLVVSVFGQESTEDTLMGVLAIVDIVMIANLIVMIFIGSYSIFVRKLSIASEKKPQWLDHITSGSLKVKISMSVVGVSTIHLLKNFIESAHVTQHDLIVKTVLHLMFIISTWFAARTNHLIEGDHKNETH